MEARPELDPAPGDASSLSQHARPERESVLKSKKRSQDALNSTKSEKERKAAAKKKKEEEEDEFIRMMATQELNRSTAEAEELVQEKDHLSLQPAGVQTVHAALLHVRNLRFAELERRTAAGTPVDISTLAALDNALAYLTFACELAAEGMAKRLQAQKELGGMVLLAEEEGRTFWEVCVRKIATCPKTPASSVVVSDASDGLSDQGGEEDDGEEKEEEDDEVSGVEFESEEGRKDGGGTEQKKVKPKQPKRKDQTNLVDRLHKIQLGRCPLTNTLSKAWRPSRLRHIPQTSRLEWYQHIKQLNLAGAPVRYLDLIASHILRHPLKDGSLATWKALEIFTGLDLSMYKSNIQSTRNAILLESSADRAFDGLLFGLMPETKALRLQRPLDESYECDVVPLDPSIKGLYPTKITLSNHHQQQNHHLPDPFLLLAHLRLGRVLRSRGMAEHIDRELSEDGEGLGVAMDLDDESVESLVSKVESWRQR